MHLQRRLLGEVRSPQEMIEKSIAEDMKDATNRPLADRVITRRAALEIKKGDILNLGIGLPVTIGLEAVNMGIATLDEITFTIELGVFGGVPAGGKDFGVTINPTRSTTSTPSLNSMRAAGWTRPSWARWSWTSTATTTWSKRAKSSSA
jgi:propionate CoA-transferase